MERLRNIGRRARRAGAVFACAGAVAALPAPAAADQPPAGSTWSEAYFESRDGTRLHADVFRPSTAGDGDRTPVMLVVSPYLGLPTREDPGPPKVLDWYRALYEGAIARGYSVVQVAFRGTAASGGCSDLGGPGEQGDVAAAVAWAASRGWSTGSVGMVGHSYDGTAAVIALGQRSPALAAAVLQGPAPSLYRGAYMNGVEYVQSRGVGAYYQGFALIPPLPDAEQSVTALGGRDLRCSASVVSESQRSDGNTEFWRERDFSDRAAGSTVPVFWAHGFLDGRDDFSAVRPDNFADLWSRLAGPRRAWFGQFPHVVPGEANTWGEPEPVGRDAYTREALDWLDAYVKDDAAARAATRREPPVAVQEGSTGAWRSEPDWPGRARVASLPLAPGAYRDEAGNKAEQGDGPGGSCDDGIRARCNPLSRVGQGTWTFSQPLPGERHVAGAARLRATLSPEQAGTRVIAIAYDIGTDNRATMLTRGAALVGADGRVEFELYPQDWRLERGHRIGLLLSGSDDFYFAPGMTGGEVRVDGGAFELPLVSPSAAFLRGDASRAIRERTSFSVDPGTIAERSSQMALPPQETRRLVVRIRPLRVRAGRRVTLRIATLDRQRRAVPRARVRIGRRLVRTDARGTARLRLRFHVAGRRLVRASRGGFTRARARVRVLR